MLRVGVIGAGSMGKNHARVYAELPDVTLVGVADINLAALEDVVGRYGAVPFRDYRDLLGQGLDAVSIAVPTSLHLQVALDTARSQTSMLVEKPLAGTLSAAKEIVEAAGQGHAKLMVGHIERFNPVVSVLKRVIKGEQVSLIETTRIGPFPPRIKDVGITVDLVPHDIDLIRYLTGSEIEKVYGLTSQTLADNEDVAVLIFKMANGTLARLTTSWLTPFKVRELSVATKEKFIKASLTGQVVTEYSKYKENGSYLVREVAVPPGEPLRLELQAFVDCIVRNSDPPVSGKDGMKVLEVIEQIDSCGLQRERVPSSVW